MLEIKVLGSGCPNCLKLENMCRKIVAEKIGTLQLKKLQILMSSGSLEL